MKITRYHLRLRVSSCSSPIPFLYLRSISVIVGRILSDLFKRPHSRSIFGYALGCDRRGTRVVGDGDDRLKENVVRAESKGRG
jgi:hypothetical protein